MDTKKRYYVKFLLFCLILSICAGCAAPKVQMYPGPPRALEQQAEIKTMNFSRGRLGIVFVDDKFTVNFFTFLFNGNKWAASASVLPGKHTIRARYDIGNSFSLSDLWWVADAGAIYILKAQAVGYGVQMWIEDERNGQIVGGIVGSSDEPPTEDKP